MSYTPLALHKGLPRRQGRALVRAIEGLSAIAPTGPIERAIAGLLLAAYRHRLRAIVEAAPAWAWVR